MSIKNNENSKKMRITVTTSTINVIKIINHNMT